MFGNHDADRGRLPPVAPVLPRVPEVGNDQVDPGGAVFQKQPVERQEVEERFGRRENGGDDGNRFSSHILLQEIPPLPVDKGGYPVPSDGPAVSFQRRPKMPRSVCEKGFHGPVRS